jgi:hypothetical protein
MNRRLFGSWGVTLSEDDFACALAALGVLQDHWGNLFSQTSHSVIAVANRLQAIEYETKGPLVWQEYIRPAGLEGDQPETFVQGWKKFIEGVSRPLRIELHPLRLDPLWTVEQLLRPNVGAKSIFVSKDKGSPNRRWHWPLRIGFLCDASSAEVLAEVKERSQTSEKWSTDLVTFIQLRGDTRRCDLLLIPHSLRDGLKSVLNHSPYQQADCAILLGSLDTNPGDTTRYLNWINGELHTNAIALVRPGDSIAEWFFRFLRHLSHDEVFDLALSNSLQSPGWMPFLMANGAWIEEVRLSSLVNMLRNKLSQSDLRKKVDKAVLGSGLKVEALNSLLSEKGERNLYLKESDAASTLAKAMKAISPVLRRSELVPVERRLQAQVFDLSDPATKSREEGRPERPGEPISSFRAGSLHRIDVRVGPLDDKWIASDRRFPNEQLPRSEREHCLTVILSEPVMVPQPQIAHIFLPAEGSSTTCSFHFQVHEGSGQVEARITVLYKNRVLQTSILKGPIQSAGKSVPANEVISFVPEVVVSPGMSDLDRQSVYGAALLLNHPVGGGPQVMKIVNERAELISTANLATFVQQIEDKLARCDWASKDFRNLSAPGTVELLRFLAAHGSLLYGGIVKQQFIDQNLAAAKRVQVIAAKLGTHLPVEYFYEFKSPDPTATLCPSAESALRAGECRDCGKRKDQNRYVCPLGFWGINRVLEWHLFRPQAARDLGNHDFALQQEKIAQRKQLEGLRAAVIGASSRVNAEVKNSVPNLIAVFKKTKVPAISVNTWQRWKTDIAAHSPSILVLIPHTDTDAQLKLPKMEIGDAQWLTLDQLDESYVRSSGGPPIVLLLGCETGQQQVSFEDFISNFAYRGAAIVVSSTTFLLGRQATLLAGEFVRTLREMSSKNGDKTFGDVVLTVRRNMLRKGYPMVLSVSSYGDADWRI